ncbi:hypothetical protein AB0I53_22330 [Saccharopolyspora sp. NPDC050389]|uniref:hypothetical protein n=1 Tax=Saccharopolyspora TaxID=1835 RepID=UPI0033D8882D
MGARETLDTMGGPDKLPVLPDDIEHVDPFEGTDVSVDGDWGGPADGYFADLFDWPKVPASGENTGPGVHVSTEALRTFATNLRSMLEPLNTAKWHIESVKLAPGTFLDAAELTGKVFGGASDGIQPTTLRFINTAQQAITKTAEELERLASEYQTAEELNAATGQDLGEHIQDAKNYITAAVNGPTSVA